MERMFPRAGQPAPDFESRSDDGHMIRLRDLRGRWVVLSFYLRAGSPGCSVQAQGLEAALPEFGRLGAQVIGVSGDTEARQASFRERCGLSYPLLPDGTRRISRAYGVPGGLTAWLGRNARVTFLIDPQGTVAHVHRGADPVTHAAAALSELRRRHGTGRS